MPENVEVLIKIVVEIRRIEETNVFSNVWQNKNSMAIFQVLSQQYEQLLILNILVTTKVNNCSYVLIMNGTITQDRLRLYGVIYASYSELLGESKNVLFYLE